MIHDYLSGIPTYQRRRPWYAEKYERPSWRVHPLFVAGFFLGVCAGAGAVLLVAWAVGP